MSRIDEFKAPWGETYRDVEVEVSHYVQDGSSAVMLLTEEDGTLAVLSTNMGGYGLYPAPGHIFIKGWSEGEGLAQAAQDAGLGTIVKERTLHLTTHTLPFHEFRMAEQYARQMEPDPEPFDEDADHYTK